MRRVLPATSIRVLHLSLVLAGLLCVAALPSSTVAATISVQGSGGDPGSSAEVQVVMTGGNRLVAGMQADISWDSSCLSVALNVPGPAPGG